jgi:hypothetical protein
MTRDERIYSLIRLFVKYDMAGLTMRANRTLDRILEVGGMGAVSAALVASNEEHHRTSPFYIDTGDDDDEV